MTVVLQLAMVRFGIKLNSRPRMMEGIMIHWISNATNWAVTVVPIFAPKMIPIA